jgi:hypothetical protein
MYTFVKYRQYLRILLDGSFYCLISIKTLGRVAKSGFLEVTDGNRVSIQITPAQVSGATTVASINTAITTALS